ncbi:hypothetical protein P6B95_33905 [Streptomyces atratus]|uniref:hypothetical protein n=1 Tax=Streptomyces atratus TaxID=1893 RepID=UPI002AC32E50|nr:hypothetical protein [Streptomyces atratus]WPW31897.1 hypothetical protein P6B95_33905 [Streptomyces atratus]
MVAVPPGMPAKWEDILAMFHDGTTKLPDRNLVAGPGSKRWIASAVNGAWSDTATRSGGEDWGFDGYKAYYFASRSEKPYLVFGFRYDWKEFGNDPGPLSDFTGAAGAIFGSVWAGTNKDTNPLMSKKAADVFNNMDLWTGGWVVEFNKWAESVGNGSEELEGKSAALFEAVLLAVKRSLLETQSYYMSGVIKSDLEAVSSKLKTTIDVLAKNAWDWFEKRETVPVVAGQTPREAGPISMPFTHLYAEFLRALAAKTFTTEYRDRFDGLDYESVEGEAKLSWLAGVKTELDDASAQTMLDLATAYDKASGKLSDANSVVKPTFTISLTPEEQKDFYGDAGAGGDGGTGGADDFLNKFKEMFGNGAGGDGAGGDGAGGEGGGTGGRGGGDLDLGSPPPVTGPSGSTSGTNLPKNNNLGLGPNPVTGPSGGTSGTNNPLGGGGSLTVPAGSRIDPKTGAVTDSKGKPVLGANGKPLIVPPGSTIGPGGKIISPTTGGPKPPTLPGGSTSGDLTRGFGVDAEGNVIVPKGTKVDAQGNLIGADGKSLTNMYGGKLTVPPGSRINADGTISDPQGKHITESSNNLKIRNPKTLDELLNGQRRPYTSSGSSGDLFGGSKGASENLRRMVDSNGNAIREPSSVVSGLSNRARAAMGLPANPAVPPTQGNVSTQSLGALGRGGAGGGTGTGTPFMPPMGMGGGGGAPGGGGNGGDRQRNVWLSEDEEVWGTEPDAGTGVIGR